MSPIARLLFLLAVHVAAPSAFAQNDEGITQEQNRTIYDVRYFAQFNALTADDLLRRIPSIQDLLSGSQPGVQPNAQDEAKRGFGSSGDQILINGRRVSGKSNSVDAALKRIDASNVARIEIIRGAVPGLDVRSEGTVVNVVLNDEIAGGSGTWEASLTEYTGKITKPGGRVSYNGIWGAFTYVLSADATPRVERRDRKDYISVPTVAELRVPDSAPFRRVDQIQKSEATDLVGAAAVTFTSTAGNILNINGQVADKGETDQLPSKIFQLSPAGAAFTGEIDNRLKTDLLNWEIGSDYEHFFEESSLKLLLIYSSSTQDDERRFLQTPVGGVEQLTRIQLQSTDKTEKILRSTYRWQPAPNHAIEVGGEAALNALDAGIRAQTFSNGVATELRLFNPNAQIKETRFETFASYSWQTTPALSLEAALDSEYSRFSQDGDDVRSRRSFLFIKPRFDVRYDITPRNQIRARVQRSVGQLNFADFVPSFSADDFKLGDVRAGNENLKPEKEWLYELTVQHRIADDQGVLTARGYYTRVSDRIERIPVRVAGQVLSATGNIGSGKIYGAELKAGVRLGWLNLPRASIDATLNFFDSEITDPFTREKRVFSQLQKFNLFSFRNEMDWRNLAYGFTYNNRLEDRNHDLDFILLANPKPVHSMFAEMRAFEGLTARLEINRMFKTGARREILLFPPPRGSAPPRQFELRKSHFAREVRLSLRGTF